MFKRMLPSRETQVRFFRFLTVGGVAAAVDFLTFRISRLWLPQLATFILAYACSTTTHYSLNRFWELPSNRVDHRRQFIEYLGMALLTIGIRYALFQFGNRVLGFSETVSYLFVALPPTTFVVFLLLNYRVFRRGPAPAKS